MIHRFFSTYQALPKPIYVLSFARFVSALGAFVYPFLTLTLTLRLKLSETEAGFVLAGIGGISMLGAITGGWLADRYQKVRFLVLAQITSAVFMICTGFISDQIYLIVPLLLSTFSISIVRPMTAALITDLTPKDKRTKAFSLGHLGTNIGFSIGPFMAAYLFERAPAWIFWGDGLTTLVAAFVVWWYLEYQENSQNELVALPPQTDLEAAVQGSIWTVLKDRPQLLWYCIASLLTSFAYAQVTFTLPITLTQNIGSEGTEIFGFVMSGNGFFVLLLTPMLTKKSEKFPNLYGLQLASLCFALGFGIISFTPICTENYQTQPLLLYVLLTLSVLIWTAGEIYSVNHGSAFVAQETPMSHRGRVNGVLPLIFGIMSSITPILSGILIARLSNVYFWILVGFVPLGAFFILTWMRIRWGDRR